MFVVAAGAWGAGGRRRVLAGGYAAPGPGTLGRRAGKVLSELGRQNPTNKPSPAKSLPRPSQNRSSRPRARARRSSETERLSREKRKKRVTLSRYRSMLPCLKRLVQAFRNWYGSANARPQRARARAETHVGIIIDRSTSRYLRAPPSSASSAAWATRRTSGARRRRCGRHAGLHAGLHAPAAS